MTARFLGVVTANFSQGAFVAVYLAKNEEPEGPYKLGKWSFRKACASLPHSFRENRQVYLQIVGLMMANDVPLRALVRKRLFRTASGMPKKSVMSNVDYKSLTRNKKMNSFSAV